MPMGFLDFFFAIFSRFLTVFWHFLVVFCHFLPLFASNFTLGVSVPNFGTDMPNVKFVFFAKTGQNRDHRCLVADIYVSVRPLDLNQRHCKQKPPWAFLRAKKEGFVEKTQT